MSLADYQLAHASVRSDALGRYYTKIDVGNFLVSQMDCLEPRQLLDLGAGGGSLSQAALAKWADARLITVDIDVRTKAHLGRVLNAVNHHHLHADVLSTELPELIFSKAGEIDVGICNPPFTSPTWRKGFGSILEDAGFSDCLPMISKVDAALLFLAQNLRVLGTTGTLGIILPDSLISSAKYRRFRRELLSRYTVHKAVRLPRGSFSGTDALAYIVTIGKGTPPSLSIPMQALNSDGSASSEIIVDALDAIERLDYHYHAQKAYAPTNTELISIPLSQVCEEFQRGSLTSAERRQYSFPIFHTADMDSSVIGRWIRFKKPFSRSISDCSLIKAKPGDILVARVGRNLEKQILGVAAGECALTDCVYRIRVPRKIRRTLLEQLTSSRGQSWLTSRVYGVSARQLSKESLLSFPILLTKDQI